MDPNTDPEAAMRMMVESFNLKACKYPLNITSIMTWGSEILIRGYRRIEALHTIIERRINPDLFSLDMDARHRSLQRGRIP